jgi:putative PIN family toxin of toxin-antitoxin system
MAQIHCILLDRWHDGIYAIIMRPIVIDTNVFVSALRTKNESDRASRSLLRAALTGSYIPLFGNALWLEYEDLLHRPVWTDATTHAERLEVLNALAAAGRWISIYYGWRPNLPDEDDNHLIELAVAGNAQAIVTHNIKDLQRGQLLWPQLRILTPGNCLKELP